MKMVQLTLSEHLRKHFCAAKGSEKLSKDLTSQIEDICNDEKRKAVEYAVVLQYWKEAKASGMVC